MTDKQRVQRWCPGATCRKVGMTYVVTLGGRVIARNEQAAAAWWHARLVLSAEGHR